MNVSPSWMRRTALPRVRTRSSWRWFHDAVYEERQSRQRGAECGVGPIGRWRGWVIGCRGRTVAAADLGDEARRRSIVSRCGFARRRGLDESRCDPGTFQRVRGTDSSGDSWVPGFLFRRKRREILDAFLARPHIYNTTHFRERYEAVARANLARSIERLS